ncbi:hypothetical protein [Paraclostridium bifermentans]|uniref:hypothetical protein n=1 Tax=Paraclostridium bifermentans TaxID=1490 RepID=UPI00359C9228
MDDRLRRSYNMVMLLLLGVIFGISGGLLDVPVLTPVLYTCAIICVLVFSGLTFSSVEKGLNS